MMDRRTTLATLLGRPARGRSVGAKKAAPPPPPGLAPYGGPWTREQAAHLLRRTTFGPLDAEIRQMVDLGMEGAVDHLFRELPLPEPPLNYDADNDPNVPIGETWIEAPYLRGVNVRPNRTRSLQGWTLQLLLDTPLSIREKLTLFWHNHFAIDQTVNDPRFHYRYITLLRRMAWGDFRQLVKEVTIDPTMLRYLNGNQNTRRAPNENYARELLELFTIGKGPLAGPGDYTNYTEEDVIQIAKVLTGWRDTGYNTYDPAIAIGANFRANQHDTGDKQLSARFDHAVITNAGEEEYARLIDLIFTKEEVANFISRKLYRWFVYYEIDAAVEAEVIAPMAKLLIDNDYRIAPALKALFSSEHFYSILNVGPMIKHPMEFLVSILRQGGVVLPQEWRARYQVNQRLLRVASALDMEYYNLPSVAGWKAYYQEPLYYRSWINANSLQQRADMVFRLIENGYSINGNRVRADLLALVAGFSDPLDVNVVLTEMAELFYPRPLTETQMAALKEILLPGLPDYEWTLEYGDYRSHPDDADKRRAMETKLRTLVKAMLNLPEFHLS